ncbi:hypothetical protein [Sinorhizobium arboris]|uniref:hypothetical protein n=1 Tax=Sinorhizobium arboris TaxID=76745 RepID=UPI00048802CD|nr:hypothetical protein [Sinorhizobium arboris]
MTTNISLLEWLNDAFEKPGGEPQSVHLDELDDWNPVKSSGTQYACEAYALLEEAARAVVMRPETNWNSIVLYLPLGMTKDIAFWDQLLWDRVAEKPEPPSLYVVRSSWTFDETSEEYRRPLAPPFHVNFAVETIFRSFRDGEAVEKDWEFCSGIYAIVRSEGA